MTGQTEAVPAQGIAGGQLQVSLNGETLALPAGSTLDALLQAAWGAGRHAAGDALYGLPPALDGLEGWIVTA